MKPVTGEIPEWLRGLSQSDEFIQYIEEAKAAVIAATGVVEPPYDALSRHLGTTKRLADLDLAGYLSMLSTIADEFDEFDGDGGTVLMSQYRSAVAANDDSVTLVGAQDWVKQNVDPIAGGAMSRLFKKPLKEAEKVLGDMLQRSWEDLVELYRTNLTGVAPFSGNLEDPPIEHADLLEALGLGSGALARVLSATEGKSIDPEAREWLTTASRVASLFFEAGTDDPHGLRLALDVSDPEYQFEGKKLKKFEGNYKLGEFFIQLGSAGPTGWQPGTNARLQLEQVPLSGPGASDYAYVEGLIEKKGGLLGRKWEEWDRRMPEVHEGALAPLKLFAAGLSPGGDQLEFQIKIDTKESEKKEKIGTIAIKARLTGDDARLLIDLLRNGLSSPPPRIEP